MGGNWFFENLSTEGDAHNMKATLEPGWWRIFELLIELITFLIDISKQAINVCLLYFQVPWKNVGRGWT